MDLIFQRYQGYHWDENLTNLSAGTGASIKPVFYSGLLTVEANATTLKGQLTVQDSYSPIIQKLSRERWLNKYLDSFMEQNASWWDEVGGDFNDIDEDGLINSQENYYGTNPLRSDTDLDGLADKQEVNATSLVPSHIVYHPTHCYMIQTMMVGVTGVKDTMMKMILMKTMKTPRR